MYTETNRERNQAADRKRMAKSGAGLAQLYRTVVLARAAAQLTPQKSGDKLQVSKQKRGGHSC